MTENEIVQYLKENKSKGVAFGFMPEEVQVWAKNNSRELCVYCQPIDSVEYEWMRSGSVKQWYLDHLYALPDDFKLKEKLKGEWVEFEIDDDDGKFGYNSIRFNGIYYWWEWQKFLIDANDNGLYFTAFGGWQYPNSSYWSTYPQVKQGRGDNYSSYYCEEEQGEGYQIEPAIPIKIRFWRGRYEK